MKTDHRPGFCDFETANRIRYRRELTQPTGNRDEYHQELVATRLCRRSVAVSSIQGKDREWHVAPVKDDRDYSNLYNFYKLCIYASHRRIQNDPALLFKVLI